MSLDDLLASRLRALRQAQGLTLEQLATRSGVSRSMISLIERQETSPTAAVLHKLAQALGQSLSELFLDAERAADELPLSRLDQQPLWQDPASGYQRRQLSPPAVAAPFSLAEVVFPPGQTVAFDPVPVAPPGHQQLWLLAGQMQVTVADKVWRLQAGDCLAMPTGVGIAFHNPGRQPARYLLALADAHPSPRSP